MTVKFIWSHRPDRMIGHLEEITSKRALELAKKIFDGVVARTPVNTGSARASWTVSLDAPAQTRAVNRDTGNPLPPPSFSLISVPKGHKVVISNATPYIVKLEYGWSKQAPQGMVRVTLMSLGVQLGIR